jgi:hypothetical protein
MARLLVMLMVGAPEASSAWCGYSGLVRGKLPLITEELSAYSSAWYKIGQGADRPGPQGH